MTGFVDTFERIWSLGDCQHYIYKVVTLARYPVLCQSSSSVSLNPRQSHAWLQLKDQEIKVVMSHKVKGKSFSNTKRLNSIDSSVTVKMPQATWISSSSFFAFDGRLAAVAYCWCYTQKRTDWVWNAENEDGCLFPTALRGDSPDPWLPSRRQTNVGVCTQNAETLLGCADWQHVSCVNATIPDSAILV